MKLTVIAGTNRRGSRSRQLAGRLHALHAAAGVDVTLLDLADLPLTIASPDAYARKPPELAPFFDAVLGADGLVVVTPEYNGGMPGILKLFIDMLPFPESFEHRPVCFVGVAAGRWGALRPVEQLQAVFGYRNAFVFPDRVFVPGAATALDPEGWPTDAFVAELLTRQAEDFRRYCRAIAPLRAPGQG
jgi:NAD(P)H-dependent FMN reductase